jgi:hypothetical protein
MNVYELDVSARLDYGVDWREWLAGPDETDDDVLVSSAWIVPAGITSENPTHDDYTTTVFLRNGVVGTTYELTNQIVTFKGRINQHTFGVRVVPIAS